MRIDAYNGIMQMYKTQKKARTSTVAKVSKRDELELSSAGKDIQFVKKAVSEAPNIREDLVESIKSRVQNGTYEVSAESFADKLIAKYNSQIKG